jgi:hypothetical protein
MNICEREGSVLMTLNDFFIQKKVEEKKDLWKQDIMKTQEYRNTEMKEKLLENRLKSYEERFASSIASDPFDEEYLEMIDLLRFIFPNIPYDRHTLRCRQLLTYDEVQTYEQLEECKKEKIISQINEDFGKCERLLGYLLLMKTSAKLVIQEDVEEKIKNLFYSFSRKPPQYLPIGESDKQTNDSSVRKKRKTHENKKELLDRLYESVFVNRSDKVIDSEKTAGMIPYINENEKAIVSFLLHIDPAEENIMYLTKQRIINQLIDRDLSESDEIQKTENANTKFNRILDMTLGEALLEAVESLHRYFKDQIDGIQSPLEYKQKGTRYYFEMKPDLLGKESVFDELNSEEVDFINYLYQLYDAHLEEYDGMEREDDYDIRNPENSRNWDILNTEERERLATYVLKLCEDDRTVLKYIREIDLINERKKKYYLFGENPAEDQDFEEQGSPLGSWKVDHANKSDEAKEIIYSLVADIGNHPYYNTYKCAERIFRFCQSTLSFTDLENPDMKKYNSKLKEQLKNADQICRKMAKCIEEERSFQMNDES